jgi:outer membrane protein assembly factor BamB
MSRLARHAAALFTILTGLMFAGCAPSGAASVKSDGETKGAVASQEDDQSTKPRESAAQKAENVADLRKRKDGDDWPRFLGPTADSKSRETGIRMDWTKNAPRLAWQRAMGAGYAMPSISRGRLFAFDQAGQTVRLACLESETGRELWQFRYDSDYEDLYGYDNGPRCYPIVDDDRVYLYGADGVLHCLDVRDGSRRWKVDTAKQFNVIQNFFGVGSTPSIDGDLLIAQVGGSPESDKNTPPGRLDLVSGNGSAVVAFDKRTGEVKYQTGDELASYAVPVFATVGDRRWGFVFARGGLVGFEPQTGKLDFHFPWRARVLESVNASNPVVIGDQVFLSECYGPGSALLRVKRGGYDVVWDDADKRPRDKSLQTHWNTPIHIDGYLYASSGRHTHEAELRCIELTSGKVQWSEPGLTRSSLLYADGHFLCLGEYGDIVLVRVNPNKYEEVTRMRVVDPVSQRDLVQYPAWGAPILSHGLLYLRGRDRLVCLELIPAPK